MQCVCIHIWPDLQLQSLFPKEVSLSSNWRSPQPMEWDVEMVFPTSACVWLPLPRPEAEDAEA